MDERQDERRELQERISDWLDVPLAVLALVMLGLLILEFAARLPAAWAERVSQAQTLIWIVFATSFAVELALAPSKIQYLKKNWLTAISVALPALRSVRLLRVARALRGISLVRVVTTLNRGTRALGHVVRRGQLGYLLLLTVVVTVTAAAAAYYLERDQPDARLTTPGDALWWAATIVTTINSSLETVTLEGRILGLLLRIFAVTIIGYLTATFAVYLLGRPAEGQEPDLSAAEVRELRLEIARLRALIEGSGGRRPQADAADGAIGSQDTPVARP